MHIQNTAEPRFLGIRRQCLKSVCAPSDLDGAGPYISRCTAAMPMITPKDYLAHTWHHSQSYRDQIIILNLPCLTGLTVQSRIRCLPFQAFGRSNGDRCAGHRKCSGDANFSADVKEHRMRQIQSAAISLACRNIRPTLVQLGGQKSRVGFFDLISFIDLWIWSLFRLTVLRQISELTGGDI